MTSSLASAPSAVTFKADLFPITVLKVSSSDLPSIKSELSATVVAAKAYFKNAPVVIDFTELAEGNVPPLEELCALIKQYDMLPVGLRSNDPVLQSLAATLNLATMKTNQAAQKKNEPNLARGKATKDSEPKAASTPKPAAPEAHQDSQAGKLVTTPVRSGVQIYARGTDLIITAAVNPGAECFADGSIHIYGPLRGKALAGAGGNENARIFCHSLEAELIAIAGHYLTHDQINPPAPHAGGMLQIYLRDKQLIIEPI
jgi:septum site-determining protein MinC